MYDEIYDIENLLTVYCYEIIYLLIYFKVLELNLSKIEVIDTIITLPVGCPFHSVKTGTASVLVF